MSLEAAVRNTHGGLPGGSIYRRPVARKHRVLPVTFVMSKTSVARWGPTDDKKHIDVTKCFFRCRSHLSLRVLPHSCYLCGVTPRALLTRRFLLGER